jgi:D-alanyl-D-alanine dipeptidase
MTPLSDPVRAAAAVRAGYRSHAIDPDDPRGRDPMTDIRTAGIAGENYYFSLHNPPYHERIAGSVPELLLRAPLVAALARVNGRLAEYDLELWVFDAWRPIAVQNHFHDVWMPAFLRRQNPALEGAALMTEVERYWARGAADGQIDPLSPPPHATGAAVDLTIRRRNGAHLFMGSIFDDVTAISNTAALEEAPALSFSDVEARHNRRLLYWLMVKEGFVNNPTEWWHFSCGDQMWARISGAPRAYYSTAPAWVRNPEIRAPARS